MRWLLAWAFYWVGHWVSCTFHWAEWLGHLYPVYNWLMLTSTRIQGNGDGPWEILQTVEQSSREEHTGQ